MPAEKKTSAPAADHLTPCSMLRLLLVMLYDAVIVFAVLMVAGAIALHLPFNNQSAGKDLAYTLYLLLAWFLYVAWCWRHGGMTLGMRAWKVRVVSDSGSDSGSDRAQQPSWRQCGLRFISAWLSAVPAGMGYWWMLIDHQQLSWHDRLSKTRLLYFKPVSANQPSNSPPQEIDGDRSQ
ncbi:MAG: RDD family protein [Xanthomonadales bacterium]|nr:RDD family protein [Xanthomonadales bacterium]